MQGGNGREVWARLGVPPGDRTVSRARPFLQHSSELGLLTEPLEGIFGRPSPWHPSGERIHPLCRNRRFVYHNIYRVAKRNRPLFLGEVETVSKRKISRRNFLQASAGGAAIAGLAGLTGGLGCGKPADSGGIKAGAAQRDITPPVGFEITHYYRVSIGIHDPLFARCLYLEDDQGNSVAMICTDLITASFDACDQMRAEIRKKTGIENSLIACSHSHSSAPLGPLLPHTRPSKPEGYPTSARDMISEWSSSTNDAILAIVQEAQAERPAGLPPRRASPRPGRLQPPARQPGNRPRLHGGSTARARSCPGSTYWWPTAGSPASQWPCSSNTLPIRSSSRIQAS